MNFASTPELDQLRASVRSFAEARWGSVIGEYDRRGEYDPETFAALVDAGLAGLCIPATWGGAGRDYLSLGVVCEELERVDGSLRIVLSVHLGLNSLALLQWATDEQKEEWLRPQATGHKLACFGLTEPDAGTDAAALTTRAERQGGDWRITGEKRWIGMAPVADHFLVFARTGEAPGARGITAFLISRADAGDGLRTYRIEDKWGLRASPTGGIVLDGVRVSDRNVLGERGEGFKIAMSALDNGRMTVAAASAGLIDACLAASVAYARRRRTFGQEIGKHQLVQQMIAEMARDLDVSRLLWQRAAWLKNEGKRCSREVAMAKWYAADAAVRAADNAVQVHGANGYSDAYPVGRYLRNARVLPIYEGSREVQQLIQADYALGYREDRPLRRTLPAYRPASGNGKDN
jgi:alkylation response protein AidB-like acyl-CoA dehydrogenase